jgi:hypothetical protein
MISSIDYVGGEYENKDPYVDREFILLQVDYENFNCIFEISFLFL